MNTLFVNVKNLTVLGLALIGITGSVQAQDWGDWGGGSGTDTAAVDSNGNMSSNSGGQRAVYKRFVPPFDTLREIIFYEGVIEDEECENCGADSLYWRAKKYLTQRWGKEVMKKMVVEDKKAERIVLKITVPMTVQLNNYNKRQVGIMEYRVALRFKDSRYKYQFGNFVHIQTPGGVDSKETRTYHEYYMKVKKGYQHSDLYLMAADREVKDIVAGLKKTLKQPYQPDEDDW
jgi:hypothetical protein